VVAFRHRQLLLAPHLLRLPGLLQRLDPAQYLGLVRPRCLAPLHRRRAKNGAQEIVISDLLIALDRLDTARRLQRDPRF